MRLKERPFADFVKNVPEAVSVQRAWHAVFQQSSISAYTVCVCVCVWGGIQAAVGHRHSSQLHAYNQCLKQKRLH